MRELKRERAQLLRGGEAAEAAVKSGRGAVVLHARNEGGQGDMSLQDMFTGLQRWVFCCRRCPRSPVIRRLKERIGSAKDGAKALGE